MVNGSNLLLNNVCDQGHFTFINFVDCIVLQGRRDRVKMRSKRWKLRTRCEVAGLLGYGQQQTGKQWREDVRCLLVPRVQLIATRLATQGSRVRSWRVEKSAD